MNYYRIVCIPSDKVDNYQYNSKDIYLVEKKVQGKNIMGRV
jgi:hypothetical protein